MSSSMLRDMLRLTYVPRWAVVPMLRQQSVAEHSFRVACIAMNIGDKLVLNEEDWTNSVMYALAHDGLEAATGDIPSSFKKLLDETVRADIMEALAEESPWFAAPPPAKVKAVVKAADLIEGLAWAERWCAEGGRPTKFEVVNGLREELTKHLNTNFLNKEDQDKILSVYLEMEGT